MQRISTFHLPLSNPEIGFKNLLFLRALCDSAVKNYFFYFTIENAESFNFSKVWNCG
jgi:hypothetical protein